MPSSPDRPVPSPSSDLARDPGPARHLDGFSPPDAGRDPGSAPPEAAPERVPELAEPDREAPLAPAKGPPPAPAKVRKSGAEALPPPLPPPPPPPGMVPTQWRKLGCCELSSS